MNWRDRIRQLRMARDELNRLVWQLAAKLTSRLPAELAHNLTIQALRLGLARLLVGTTPAKIVDGV